MSLPRLPDFDREIASYAAELVALVDEVSPASAERTDAADGGLMPRVLAVFNPRRLARLFLTRLRRRARAGEAAAREVFRRQARAYVSVRPRLGDASVATVLRRAWPTEEPEPVLAGRREWIVENVRLIRSIGTRLHAELGEVIAEATEKGSRQETLEKRIAERFDVARSRARLIARDQVTKYLAQVNEAQQRRAGVERYVWRHSRSRRNPRRLHLGRDGKVFNWAGPPSDGHPGAAPNCRCTAEPVLTGILTAEA